MSLIIKKQNIAKTKEFAEVEWANITSIFGLIFVFGRSVFAPKKIIGSFLLVIIFAIGTLAIAPYYYSYGITAILCLYLISSFVYGSIFYSFRKSTLTDNIKGTNLTKFDIYFSFLLLYLFLLPWFIYLLFPSLLLD